MESSSSLYDPAVVPEMPIERLLTPVVGGLGMRASVSVAVTGLPAGGHGCVSYAGFFLCYEDDISTLVNPIPLALFNEDRSILVTALDADGELYDAVRTTMVGDADAIEHGGYAGLCVEGRLNLAADAIRGVSVHDVLTTIDAIKEPG